MSLIQFHIDQPGQPFTPYWKKCIAAGRAAEGLRQDWRRHLLDEQFRLYSLARKINCCRLQHGIHQHQPSGSDHTVHEKRTSLD